MISVFSLPSNFRRGNGRNCSAIFLWKLVAVRWFRQLAYYYSIFFPISNFATPFGKTRAAMYICDVIKDFLAIKKCIWKSSDSASSCSQEGVVKRLLCMPCIYQPKGLPQKCKLGWHKKKKKKSIKHIIPVHSRVLDLLKYFAYFDTSIIYKKWLSIISTLHNSYSYLVLQNDLPLRLF